MAVRVRVLRRFAARPLVDADAWLSSEEEDDEAEAEEAEAGVATDEADASDSDASSPFGTARLRFVLFFLN